MAFNQNQDTLRTLKLVIFLIVIEFLFFSASAVLSLTEDKQTDFSFSDVPKLYISDFKWNEHAKGGGYFSSSGGYEAIINGITYTIYIKKGDTVALQKVIDEQNLAEMQSGFDLLKYFVATVTFSYVPFPFNIIPILVVSLIGFVVIYLTYGEVKAWLSTIRG
jgi:hypothetical protein